MTKDSIVLIADISGMLAIITWLSVFLYFTVVGVDAMLIRMTITWLSLSVIHIYFTKKKPKEKQ